MSSPVSIATPKASGQPPKRVYLLDCLRFIGVTLAIVSHVALSFELYDPLASDAGLIGKFITRSATPTLLIVFGMMIEVAYAKRYEASPSQATIRLYSRSIDVAFAYMLAVIVITIPTLDIRYFARALLFTDGVGNFAIFRIYLFLLIVTPAILWFRTRLGGWMYPAILLVVVAYDLAVAPISVPAPLDRATSVLGIGDGWGPGGPQSIAFLLGGMAFASLFGQRRMSAAIFLAVLAAVSTVVVIASLLAIGLRGYMLGIADASVFRNSSAPEYFAYGFGAFLALIVLSWLFSLLRWRRLEAMVVTVGSNTLTYFFTANLIIAWSALAIGPLTSSFVSGLAASVAVIGTAIATVYGWNAVMRKPRVNRLARSTRTKALRLMGFREPALLNS